MNQYTSTAYYFTDWLCFNSSGDLLGVGGELDEGWPQQEVCSSEDWSRSVIRTFSLTGPPSVASTGAQVPL